MAFKTDMQRKAAYAKQGNRRSSSSCRPQIISEHPKKSHIQIERFGSDKQQKEYLEAEQRDMGREPETSKFSREKPDSQKSVDELNAQTSAKEVAQFKKDTSDKPYSAYMSMEKKQITTWTGEKLADVQFIGKEYHTASGDTRINFRAKGIDGRTWSGTYYKSSGDYVRMKPLKKKVYRDPYGKVVNYRTNKYGDPIVHGRAEDA